MFCYRLFGRRLRSNQFGSKLSIAFREVPRFSFTVVLAQFGVRPLFDSQAENAFQLGPKSRERDSYAFVSAVSGAMVVSVCPEALVAAVAAWSIAGCSGPCASKTRNSSAGSIAKPPSAVLCADSLPSRTARQMSTLLVPTFSAASPRLRETIASHLPCDRAGDEDGKRG